MKGEMVDSSVTQAGLELAEAGVIWVVAAGNSGQTQTRPEDPDFNSYCLQLVKVTLLPYIRNSY